MRGFILTLTAIAGLALFATSADANGRGVAFRGGVRNGGFGQARFNGGFHHNNFNRGIAFRQPYYRNNFAFRSNFYGYGQAFRQPFYGYSSAAFAAPCYGGAAYYAPQQFAQSYCAPVAFSSGCGGVGAYSAGCNGAGQFNSGYYGGGSAGFSQPSVNVTQNLSGGELGSLVGELRALTQEMRQAFRQPPPQQRMP